MVNVCFFGRININSFYLPFVSMIVKKPDGRFWEIDLLRGVAIILMIIFHCIYDLNHLGIIQYQLWHGPFAYTSKIISSVFLLLVGLSLTISFNKTKQVESNAKISYKFIRRGFKLFSLGLMITIISWFIIPERFVLFGILHCIGLSIILSVPFIRYIIPNLLLGGSLVLFGIYLQYVTFDFIWFIPLGVLPPNYFSIDFFPILPWFGVVLLGIALGNFLYPNAKRRYHLACSTDYGIAPKLCFIGRHSLPVYFLHQPIIFGLIFLFLK